MNCGFASTCVFTHPKRKYYVSGNHDAYEGSVQRGSNGNTATIWTNSMAKLTDLVKGPDVITQDSKQSGFSYSFMHNGSLLAGLD